MAIIEDIRRLGINSALPAAKRHFVNASCDMLKHCKVTVADEEADHAEHPREESVRARHPACPACLVPSSVSPLADMMSLQQYRATQGKKKAAGGRGGGGAVAKAMAAPIT